MLSGIIGWALCVFSLVLIWPSSDNRWRPQPGLHVRHMTQGLNSVTTALFPWIDRTPHIFKVVNDPIPATSAAVVTTLLVAVSAWRRSWLLGAHAVISSGLLIAYFALGNYFFWWHVGVLYLNFIGILFLSVISDSPLDARARTTPVVTYLTLLAVLIAQVYAVFVPPGYDLLGHRPYSNAKRTVEFVRTVCDSDCVVLVSRELNTSAIPGYLERPVYYVDRGRMGTYAPWGDQKYLPREWSNIVAAARLFPNAVIITDERRGKPKGVRLLASFSGAVWLDENFEVWRLSAPRDRVMLTAVRPLLAELPMATL